MRSFKLIFAACCLAWLCSQAVEGASYELDGGLTTNITSNWNVPDTEIFIGSTTSNNTMIVLPSVSVSNRSTYVGRDALAAGNRLLVNGSNSCWASSDYMRIGHYGSGNTLVVSNNSCLYNGSTAVIGVETGATANVAIISGAHSVWTSSGSITVGYAGHHNSLRVENGGSVENGGLELGYLASGNSNEVTVTGDGSTMVNRGFVAIGRRGSGNSLVVAESGRLEAPIMVIGAYGSAFDNRVVVTGAGSEVVIDGTLLLGGYFEPSGSGNALLVLDNGFVSAIDMENRNESMVVLGNGSRISVDSYFQDAGSTLGIMVYTNSMNQPVNGLLQVAGTAEFEAGATIELTSGIGLLQFDRYYTNDIVVANRLIVDGEDGATTEDLEKLNIHTSLLYVRLMEADQDVRAVFSRRRLAEVAGFADGTQMARIADTIDHVGLSGSQRATTQVHILNTLSDEQIAGQLTQLYEQGVASYKHQQSIHAGMDSAFERSRKLRQADKEVRKPVGAEGPHDPGQGAKLWMNGYGQTGEQDESGQHSGYKHHAGGIVIGYDRIYGKWLLGLAGGYTRSQIDEDDGDMSNADTYYGMAYGSVGSEDLFGDLGLVVGRSDIRFDSGTVFDTTGDTMATHLIAYAGGGKETKLGKGAVLTPEIALRTGLYSQGDFIDDSNNALPREVDGYDHWSIQSIIGTRFDWKYKSDHWTFAPRGRFFWIHEYNDDDDTVSFTVGGTGGNQLIIQGADANLLKAGAGLYAATTKGWSFILDIDGYWGNDHQSCVLSGRISYEF